MKNFVTFFAIIGIIGCALLIIHIFCISAMDAVAQPARAVAIQELTDPAIAEAVCMLLEQHLIDLQTARRRYKKPVQWTPSIQQYKLFLEERIQRAELILSHLEDIP